MPVHRPWLVLAHLVLLMHAQGASPWSVVSSHATSIPTSQLGLPLVGAEPSLYLHETIPKFSLVW